MAKQTVFTPESARRVGAATRQVERWQGQKGVTGNARKGTVFGDPDFRAVIVKRNGGTDGGIGAYATYSYDLYDPLDTTYSDKLNESGALQPEHCYTRGWKMSVTAAADGSIGIAYDDTSGNIKLWDCKEVPATQKNC